MLCKWVALKARHCTYSLLALRPKYRVFLSTVNLKIWQQMACLRTKLHFLANGCVLGQNARKETPFKIQFYCQDNINLLSAPFLKLINGICLFFCLLAGNLQPNFQIALTYSILKLKSILIPPDKMT